MARYLLIKDGAIQDAIELDPANIYDGKPCPPELLHLVPQPDKVTPQPPLVEKQKDLMVPQPDVPKLNDDGKPVLDEDGQPVMISQPDLAEPQPDKVTYQPDLVEPQPDIEMDVRYRVPDGYDLEQSDVGNPGQKWPLPVITVDPNQSILEQIRIAESTVTDRRVREAILAIDNSWLKNVNSQIAALRSKLT